MDPIQPNFFEASVELEHEGENLHVRGLVSEFGVTRIVLAAGLPEYWARQLGRRVNVHLDAVRSPAVLLKQQVEHGCFYELRFEKLGEPFRRYLRERARQEGRDPGWKRAFPRIAVNRAEDPSLPVPNLCLVRFVGQELFVNVLNFTMGGLRIETIGDDLGDVRVGAHVGFDLLTSNGEILHDLKAEVRNLAVHGTGGPEAPYTRSFGLRFTEMSAANEEKYRRLIRDYCRVLQFRLNGRLA